MAKNLLSVNLKYYKSSEIDRIVNHNNRLSSIDYLLEIENIKHKNIDIIYNNFNDNNDYLYRTGDYENQKNKINEYNLDNKINGDLLKFETLNLLNEKKKIQAKNKSYTKKNENELVEMVIALSEEQALEYLNNNVDIMKGFDKFALNLKEKYGFTPIGLSLHLDEGYIASNDDIENNIKKGDVKYNIHAHLVLLNFDFKKERSVLRNMKKQDMRDLQDLCQDSFQSMNLDFKRGVSKKITNKDHLEKNEFIIEKQEKQIEKQKKVIKDLQNSATNGLNFIMNLKNDIKDNEIKLNKINTYISDKSTEAIQLKKSIDSINLQKNNSKNQLKLLNLELNNYLKDNDIDVINDNDNDLINLKNNIDLVKKNVKNFIDLEQNLRELKRNIDQDVSSKLFEKDQLIENIQNLNNDLRKKNQEFNDLDIKINDKKKDINDLDNKINNKNIEFNDLDNKINDKKKELELNDYENFENLINKEIDKCINDLIENPIVGSKNIKNIDQLKKNVSNSFKKFSKYDFVIKKYKEDRLELLDLKAIKQNLTKENENLKEKNIESFKLNQKLIKDKQDLINKIDPLNVEIKALELQNINSNDLIKKYNKFLEEKGLAEEFEKIKTIHRV